MDTHARVMYIPFMYALVSVQGIWDDGGEDGCRIARSDSPEAHSTRLKVNYLAVKMHNFFLLPRRGIKRGHIVD